MRLYRSAFHFVLASCLVLSTAVAAAQTSTFEPQSGQPGKDVVWVPSSRELVERMLDMARVTANDYVIDLGSGDGRTVIAAAKRGARALGVEYNPDMVELSRRNAAREGIAERAQFIKADLFEIDLSQATVITMYLLPSINLKLRPKLLGLKPGTRIVSNTFDMGEWQDDDRSNIAATGNCTTWCTAHLWIVPARVEGRWKGSAGDLTLSQQYQMVSGTLRTTDGLQTFSGTLRGDEISFIAGGAAYVGRVNGSSIEWTVISGGNKSRWTATRVN